MSLLLPYPGVVGENRPCQRTNVRHRVRNWGSRRRKLRLKPMGRYTDNGRGETPPTQTALMIPVTTPERMHPNPVVLTPPRRVSPGAARLPAP